MIEVEKLLGVILGLLMGLYIGIYLFYFSVLFLNDHEYFNKKWKIKVAISINILFLIIIAVGFALIPSRMPPEINWINAFFIALICGVSLYFCIPHRKGEIKRLKQKLKTLD